MTRTTFSRFGPTRHVGHLRALLWKEWRDVRTVTLVVAGLSTPVALLAAWFDVYAKADLAPELVFASVLPALLGLWLGLVASDLFSRDTSTRRIEALGLLPTSLSTIWTSKLLFLATGTAVLGAWIVTQLWIGTWLVGLPRGLGHTVDLAVGSPLVQAGLLLLAGLLVFASTLGLRGFASVGLAAVWVGLSVYAGVVWPWADWGLPPTGTFPLLASALLATGLVVASAVGFVKGSAHRGRRAVVAGLAVATLGCVLLPTGLAAATAVRARLDLPHGDPETRLLRLTATPDGEWVAVEVQRARAPFTRRVRCVRLSTGEVADTTAAGHRLTGVYAPNLVEVQRMRHTLTGETVAVETRAVDPHGREQVLAAGDPSPRRAMPPATRLADDLWHVPYLDDGSWVYRRVRSEPRPLRLADSALLLVPPGGGVTHLDLASGVSRSLGGLELDRVPTSADLAPDGSSVVLGSGGVERVHRTDDLTAVAALPGTGWRWEDAGHLVRAAGERWELFRLADGVVVDLGLRPGPAHRSPDLVDVLPDGRLVVTRPGDVLWLLTPDGAPERELVRLRGD